MKLQNDVKRSHQDSRFSLSGLHEETVESHFEYKRKNLPLFKNELEILLKSEPISRIEKLEKERNIQKIKLKIENLEKDVDLTNYMLKASKFINKYYKEKNRSYSTGDIDVIDTTNGLEKIVIKEGSRNLGSLYKEYVEECQDQIVIPYLKNDNILVCEFCKQDLILDSTNASAICNQCGNSIDYQDDISIIQWSEECEALSPFAYKRINHFKEWLSQFQAKETTEIPTEIINLLLKELKKERITDNKQVTSSRIKGYLKKLRLNKYYEHIPSIINTLCGLPPPILTSELEEKLIHSFKIIQTPFEKHVPKDRKNFLSYSYTLHKLCQLENQNQFLSFFPLLKSREKLYQQDCIWKGICSELGWKFIKSV